MNLADLAGLWFDNREDLKEKDLKRIFNLFLDINNKLGEIEDILNE